MLNAKDLELMARYCVQFSIDNGVPRGKAAEAAQDLFMQFSNAGRLTGSGGLRFILGNKYPDYFCKAYLSDQFDREFGPYAIEILRSSAAAIEAKTRSKKADVAPRGHGKSTLDSFAIPTWAAAYQKKKFILFISANYDTSKNFLGKVRKALESPAITEDFGPQVGGAWSAEELCTASGTWVKCAGWKAGLRGMIKDVRPDLICLDDLEDKEVMESLPMQHKLDDCFNNEIGRLGDYNTDFIYIGTLLSEDSLLARTMQNPAWHSRVYKRVISFPDRQDLWDEWRRIYCDISNENRHDDAWAFYLQHKAEMNAGAKVLWEDKVPAASTKYPGGYYNVMLDRVAFGEDAFWQEDQSEPAKASDKPFKTLTFWQARYKEETEYRAALRDITLTVDPSEGKGQEAKVQALQDKLDEMGWVKGGVNWHQQVMDLQKLLRESNTEKYTLEAKVRALEADVKRHAQNERIMTDVRQLVPAEDARYVQAVLKAVDRAEKAEKSLAESQAVADRMREALPLIRAVSTIMEDCDEEVIESGGKTITIDRGNFIVLIEAMDKLEDACPKAQWGVAGREDPFSTGAGGESNG